MSENNNQRIGHEFRTACKNRQGISDDMLIAAYLSQSISDNIVADQDFQDAYNSVTVGDILNHPMFAEHSASVSQNYIGAYDEPFFRSDLDIFSNPEYSELATRTAFNIALQRYAEGLEGRVGYQMGAKIPERGLSDCSGFVQGAFEAISGDMRGLFATHSEGQVASVASATRNMLSGSEVTYDALQPGMVIGIDSGSRRHDAGREIGIDHVGYVFMDENGDMQFAHCGSRSGVEIMPLEEALERYGTSRHTLYAVDPVSLVEDREPAAENDAERNPEAETVFDNDTQVRSEPEEASGFFNRFGV